MPDLEKVLKALEHHKETAVCNGCPYAEDDDTVQGYCPIYDDAIALLKEQEDDTDWKAVAMILADTLSEVRTDMCCDSRCGQGFHCVGHSELGFVPTRCWIEWAKGEKLWRPEVSDDD